MKGPGPSSGQYFIRLSSRSQFQTVSNMMIMTIVIIVIAFVVIVDVDVVVIVPVIIMMSTKIVVWWNASPRQKCTVLGISMCLDLYYCLEVNAF